jgi:hypothetical protein
MKNEIERDDYRMRTGVDLWRSFDDVDSMIDDGDMKRAAVRRRVNKRSLKALKRSLATGNLKPEMLAMRVASDRS